MASWESDVAQSNYDANSVISSMEKNRNRDSVNEFSIFNHDTYKPFTSDKNGDKPGSIGGYQGPVLGSTGEPFVGPGGLMEGHGYNVVGINGNEIVNMCGAIEEYVNGVRGKLDDALVATEETLQQGFKGSEAESAVKAYLDKVKEYVNNLTSSLNSFQSKLNDIGNAWVKAQASFGTNVNSSAGAFSAGTEYTQQVQYNGPSGS